MCLPNAERRTTEAKPVEICRSDIGRTHGSAPTIGRLRHFRNLNYWTSQSKAEVDFLISEGLNVIPLECKAGYTMNAKSLKSYREKYSPTMSLRTSLLPYERNEGVCNIPLYILFAINNEIRTTEEFHFLS